MYIVSVNDVDRDLPGGGSGVYEQWGLLQPPLLLQADVLHQLRYQPYTLQYNENLSKMQAKSQAKVEAKAAKAATKALQSEGTSRKWKDSA